MLLTLELNQIVRSFVDSENNSSNNFIKNEKYEIFLKDIARMLFVPFGASNLKNPNNKTYDKTMSFHGSVIRGVFERITLEIKRDGKYFKICQIEGLFTANKNFKFEWDGFIDEVYDSKFFTAVQGVEFRVKGFNGGNEMCLNEKIFQFKYFKENWIDVRINKKLNHIFIKLRVNLIDGGARGLSNGNLVPREEIEKYKTRPYTTQTQSFKQLLSLALTGINYYWSRNNNHPTGKNITLNDKKYEVFVKAELSSANAIPEMKLTYVTNLNPNDPLFRSSNWFASRKTAYVTGYLKFDSGWGFYQSDYSNKKFKETIAHETGHAIVTAYAGTNESIKHHDSSGYSQTPNKGTKYPSTGEIDLMKYAEDELSISPNWDTRIIANEQDVAGLLVISGISKK